MLKEWAEASKEALIVIAILFFVFWPINVDGSSMESTFKDGDKIGICRAMTILDKYEPQDIIVFSGTVNGEKIKLIKRVIALSGDHLQIHNGEVYVNGKKINESYIVGNTYGDIDLDVPKGELFVMGDNRENSYDSREMGTISKAKVKGKVILRFYPFDEISVFK